MHATAHHRRPSDIAPVARRDEEVVRQPIQVGDRGLRCCIVVVQRDYETFGAPADRPRYVQLRRGESSAWQNEALERCEIGFHRIDPAFELLDA